MEQKEKKVLSKVESQQKPDSVVETSISTSKDGLWVITKTTVTTIKHINYYKAITASKGGDLQ
jgi:hypothetical protein